MDEDLNERKRLIDFFERGDYQVLVAMRCLDEGVDIPIVKHAIIMSSSGNSREYIQRRGRVLRSINQKIMGKLMILLLKGILVMREIYLMLRKIYFTTV